MNNEYFLNQWFSQSLERSRQTVLDIYPHNINQSEQKSMLKSNQLLFPINLRSSECWFLPPIVLETLSNNKHPLMYVYPLSLFKSFHSFSFCLFLPYQCNLVIRVSNLNVNGQHILLRGNENYYFDNGNCVSINDRWTICFKTQSI